MRIVFYTIYIYATLFNPHYHKAFNRVFLGFSLRIYTGAAKDMEFIGDIANEPKILTNVSQLRNNNKWRYSPTSILLLYNRKVKTSNVKNKLKYLL